MVVLVNGKGPHKPRIVSASTDLALDGRKLVEYDMVRFQIEFLFRDSKQFTGLADCQARAETALDFHFNARAGDTQPGTRSGIACFSTSGLPGLLNGQLQTTVFQ
ncbi:MAG: hypothetical protein HY268_07135 [Deltaproteobacteria bacterium]|nr:hypothetical protein [Deltaproteobacteria bacterium]